jgi:hypothetical protein
LTPVAGPDCYEIDQQVTHKLRAERRQQRTASLPMIDRGPGYEELRQRVS